MRILTVRQPWAWAIIHGGKDVENRVRNIAGSYRGPVAIHAGLQHDRDHDRQLIGAAVGAWSRANPGVSSADDPDPRKSRPVWYGNLGRIIGVVDLVDAHPAKVVAHITTATIYPEFEVTCCSSRWAEPHGHHLVLANARPLAEPIPYKGALGLRKTEFAVVNDYLVAPWDHGPGSCTPYGCEPWCNFEPVARLEATS